MPKKIDAPAPEIRETEAENPTPKEQGSPAVPDHLRPGLSRRRAPWEGFAPVEEDPELLAKIQDPSGSRQPQRSEQLYVDGTNAWGHPVKIPI